jgi:ubiquitin-like 1-activating enzyme E1 A
MSSSSLSAEDEKLYDRQIRVWGFEGQRRLQDARILVSKLTGSSAEISKNLVLAGVASLHVHDSSLANWRNLSANFLASENDASDGKALVCGCVESLQELNPRVKVSGTSSDDVNLISMIESRHYSAVLVSSLKDYAGRLDSLVALDNACRRANVPFVFVDCAGYFALSFLGGGGIVPIGDDDESTLLPSLSDAIAPEPKRRTDPLFAVLKWFLIGGGELPERLHATRDEFARTLGLDLSPVCAVIGGLVGQELIKRISASGDAKPFYSFCFYNTQTGAGNVVDLL